MWIFLALTFNTHTETGELFLWGSNLFGQLGTGDTKNRATPTLVAGLAGRHVLTVAFGAEHTLILIQ